MSEQNWAYAPHLYAHLQGSQASSPAQSVSRTTDYSWTAVRMASMNVWHMSREILIAAMSCHYPQIGQAHQPNNNTFT